MVPLLMALLLGQAGGSQEAPRKIEGRGIRIPVSGRASQWLREIAVITREEEGNTSEIETTFKRLPDGTISIDMGVGESPGTIYLQMRTVAPADVRVQQQSETSLTVQDEGPHVDLLNWEHGVSPWVDAERGAPTSFRLQNVRGDAFPEVTAGQIVEAVKAEIHRWPAEQSGEDPGRWSSLAQKCNTPRTYPCSVGVSKVRLRIQIKTRDAWKDIQLMELNLSTGC